MQLLKSVARRAVDEQGAEPQLNATVAKLFFVGHAVFVIWNLLTQMPNPVIKIG